MSLFGWSYPPGCMNSSGIEPRTLIVKTARRLALALFVAGLLAAFLVGLGVEPFYFLP